MLLVEIASNLLSNKRARRKEITHKALKTVILTAK